MTDPLTDRLADLAPTVDTHHAHAAFTAERIRRRHQRRWLQTGVAALITVTVIGVGVVLLRPDGDPGTVATSNPTATDERPTSPPARVQPAPSASPGATSTTGSAPVTVDEPLLAVDGCPVISATDLNPTAGLALFGRPTPEGVSIQAVATPNGIEGPYVAVLRYLSEPRTVTFGDRVDINGHEARLFTGASGPGELSWILDDGSEAYLRSRDITADDLIAIANALTPRPANDSVPGFDLDADGPAGFSLVAETVTPVNAATATSTCHPTDGSDLRVGVIDAPLAAQYAFGVDSSPLPTLQQHGSHMFWAISRNPATAAAALGITPDAPASGPTTTAPTPTVTFTIDRSAIDQPSCTNPTCRFVDVTLSGFLPDTTVTITCHSETTGPFGATPATITIAGTAEQQACYFGYPGERFWVTADGITSPTITWPTN